MRALDFYFTYNSSELVGSAFGGTWEDPRGCFFKFAVKRDSEQDQIVHMEVKLQFICYFSSTMGLCTLTTPSKLKNQFGKYNY